MAQLGFKISHFWVLACFSFQTTFIYNLCKIGSEMDSFIDFFEENNTKNLLQEKKANPTEQSLLPNKVMLTQSNYIFCQMC